MSRILIAPPLFYNEQSGAVASREAARLLTKIGNEVAVYTPDTPYEPIYKNYVSVPYNGFANIIRTKYRKVFTKVLDDFKPDFVFFIGGVIGTPIVYLNICRRKRIKAIFLHLMQDFFCSRLHAGLGSGPCTRCLDGSNFNSLVNNCLEKGSNKWLYFLNYQINQFFFRPALKKIDYILGSTKEQLGFYKKFGVKSEKCAYIPLFFNQKRVKYSNRDSENYFVFIAQNRHEKGIHLISKILRWVSKDVKIKAIFYNTTEAEKFIKSYPENREYLNNGTLEVIGGITITQGAVDLISRSKGVIIPSIWPSTTEFVFLEALGIGKPVIAFNVGIHKEVISNNYNGLIINPGDFKEMGRQLSRLIHSDMDVKRISENGRRLFETLTSDEAYNTTLKRIFQTI